MAKQILQSRANSGLCFSTQSLTFTLALSGTKRKFHHIVYKGKRQRHSTHMKPQAAYRSCSGALCQRHSQRTASAAAKLVLKDVGLQPYVVLVCHLMVSTPKIHGSLLTY